MATTNSDFDGSLGGLSFYKRNGKTIVRRKGGPTSEQIKNKTSCEAIRDSNYEFGGASKVCGIIRLAIGPDWRQYSDMDLIGRLTGQLKKIISKGTGRRGARVLDLAAHAEMLEGFEFNQQCPFKSRFKKDISITLSEDRNTAVLHTAFRPATDIIAPDGATSFQLKYVFMRVPAYGVSETTGRYEPLHTAVLDSAQVSSASLYTKLELPVKLSLPLTLPVSSSAEGMALLCVVAIGFYKGQERMGKEVCGMKVVMVG